MSGRLPGCRRSGDERSGGRPDPAQVVTLVEAHRHTFGVAPLLAAIGEPVSTFYDRVSRTPSARAVADAAVVERIEAIWERSRLRVASPAAGVSDWTARSTDYSQKDGLSRSV